MRIPGSGTPSRIISIGELAVKDGDKQEPPDSPVKHSNDNACHSEAIKEVARPAGFEPATAGLEIRRPTGTKGRDSKDLEQDESRVRAPVRARTAENDPNLTRVAEVWPSLPRDARQLLKRLADSWQELPEAVRQGIEAMISTAEKE